MLADSPLDTALNAGLLIGRELLHFNLGSLAVEGEGTFTVRDGDADEYGLNGDWRIRTASLWLAYRGSRVVYPVVKLGVEHVRFSIVRPFWNDSVSDTGVGLSLGLGARVSSRWKVEAEYSPKGRINFADTGDKSYIRFLGANLIYRF